MYVPHDHREYVDGCFRCELGRDEVESIRRDEEAEARALTLAERSTYMALRARGIDHDTAIEAALDGVHVDDVRNRT